MFFSVADVLTAGPGPPECLQKTTMAREDNYCYSTRMGRRPHYQYRVRAQSATTPRPPHVLLAVLLLIACRLPPRSGSWLRSGQSPPAPRPCTQRRRTAAAPATNAPTMAPSTACTPLTATMRRRPPSGSSTNGCSPRTVTPSPRGSPRCPTSTPSIGTARWAPIQTGTRPCTQTTDLPVVIDLWRDTHPTTGSQERNTPLRMSVLVTRTTKYINRDSRTIARNDTGRDTLVDIKIGFKLANNINKSGIIARGIMEPLIGSRRKVRKDLFLLKRESLILKYLIFHLHRLLLRAIVSSPRHLYHPLILLVLIVILRILFPLQRLLHQLRGLYRPRHFLHPLLRKNSLRSRTDSSRNAIRIGTRETRDINSITRRSLGIKIDFNVTPIGTLLSSTIYQRIATELPRDIFLRQLTLL